MSRFERRITPVVRIRRIERGGTHLVLQLESWYGAPGPRVRFERRGKRTFWLPPTENLSEAVPEEDREVTGELRRANADVFLHNVEDESEYLLPARTEAKQHVEENGRVRVRLHTAVPIAPTAAAAGGPLPPGRWEVRIAVTVAGFRHDRARAASRRAAGRHDLRPGPDRGRRRAPARAGRGGARLPAAAVAGGRDAQEVPGEGP